MKTVKIEENEFEYRVSIVMPVYNVEKYLRDSLNSLLNQTISQDEMEVLMINDGSTDGSLAICESYAEKYKNFKVISQENQGVSAARNNGIKNAKGKYILYLDSDDTLSEKTVKNVTDFFDEHYNEVDIVGYPIIFCYKDGRKIRHNRDSILKTTAIYDIEKTLYVNLTTVNVVVKNFGKANKLFNTTMQFHEDEEYITHIVMGMKKFGYIREARYLYKKNGEGVSEKFVNPYYTFEPNILFYERICKQYKNNNKIKKYVQNLILNDFNWKIKQDVVYPYHYTYNNFKYAENRLKAIIEQLDVDFIIGCPYMKNEHKFFLLSLTRKTEMQIKIFPDFRKQNNQLSLHNDFGILRQINNILIVLNRCKFENNSFYLLAYLKEPIFAFTEKPKLFAVINDDKREEIPLFLSQHSCYWSLMRTNTFWGFSYEIDITDISSLKFIVQLDRKELSTNFYYTNRQSIQPKLHRPYLEGTNFSIIINKNEFISIPSNDEKFIAAKKRYERFLKKQHAKQWLIHKYVRKKSEKKIWLYQDTYNATDNAYYQFQNDFSKNDGIKRYYICDKKNLEWKNKFQKKQRKFLVQRKSKKHKMLFIQSDKILTSFAGRSDFVPFDNNTILFYWDMFKFEVVYLQHGVMHAHLPNMYSKEKVYFVDKIVVSTEFEKQNLEKLAYRPKDILCTGMPRFDSLKIKENKHKILFVPSWRLYLLVKNSEGKWEGQKNFEQTDYFNELQAFLNDEKLLYILQSNGYSLDIKLHPNFDVYKDVFKKFCHTNISLVDDIKLGEYTACITDFTSFMYDFFYLDIPVITHIFDKERFKAGLHTYRELCWNMEEDYPLHCKTPDEVVLLLQKIISGDAVVKKQFLEFKKKIFFSVKYNSSNNNCERVYNAITELEK